MAQGRRSPRSRVLYTVTIRLTCRHQYSYIQRIKSRPQGRRPVMPAGRGECGARGRGFIIPAPGRLGHHACRHYDRRARCSLDWDRLGAAVMAAQQIGRVPGSLARAEPRDDRLPGREPWWNAGRRARPQAERRRKPLSPWRAPRAACVRDMKHCVCRRSASLFLSSLCRVGLSQRSPRGRGSKECTAWARRFRAFAHPTASCDRFCLTRAHPRRENEFSYPPLEGEGRAPKGARGGVSDDEPHHSSAIVFTPSRSLRSRPPPSRGR